MHKLLTGLNQNGEWSGARGQADPCHGRCTTGPEARPSPCTVMKVNESRPAVLLPPGPWGGTACSQETPTGRRAGDEGASERRPVMGRIGVELVPPTTSLPREGRPTMRRSLGRT